MPPADTPVRTIERRRLVLFLLAVLAARMFVPAGYMPAARSAGTWITLCTGEGMVSAWVGADGRVRGDPERPPATGDRGCAFAALAAPAAIAAAGAFAPNPPAPLPALFAGLAAVSIGRGLAAPPPPSTGPPISA